MSIQERQSINQISVLQNIAHTLSESTQKGRNLTDIFIRSFEDSNTCIVKKADTSWFSRMVEVFASYFSSKQVRPYSLVDNFQFLHNLITNSSVSTADLKIPVDALMIEEFKSLVPILETFASKINKESDKAKVLSIVASIKVKMQKIQGELDNSVTLSQITNNCSDIKKKIMDLEKQPLNHCSQKVEIMKIRSGFERLVDEVKKQKDSLNGITKTSLKERETVEQNIKGLEESLKSKLTSCSNILQLSSIYQECSKTKESLTKKQALEISEKEELDDVIQEFNNIGKRVNELYDLLDKIEEPAPAKEAVRKATQEIFKLLVDKNTQCGIVRAQVHSKSYENRDLTPFNDVLEKVNKSASLEDLFILAREAELEIAHIETVIKKLTDEKRTKPAKALRNEAKKISEMILKATIDKSILLSKQERNVLNDTVSNRRNDIITVTSQLCIYELHIKELKTFAEKAPKELVKDLESEIKLATQAIKTHGEAIAKRYVQEKAATEKPVSQQAHIQADGAIAAFGNINIGAGAHVVINITSQAQTAAGGGEFLSNILPQALLAVAGLGAGSSSTLGVAGALGTMLGFSPMVQTAQAVSSIGVSSLLFNPIVTQTAFYMLQDHSFYEALCLSIATAVVVPIATQQISKLLPDSIRQNQHVKQLMTYGIQFSMMRYGGQCLKMIQSTWQPVSSTTTPLAEAVKTEPPRQETSPQDLFPSQTPVGATETVGLIRVGERPPPIRLPERFCPSGVMLGQTPAGAIETVGFVPKTTPEPPPVVPPTEAAEAVSKQESWLETAGRVLGIGLIGIFVINKG